MTKNIDPELVETFKKAWAVANAQGMKGRRVAFALGVVFETLGIYDQYATDYEANDYVRSLPVGTVFKSSVCTYAKTSEEEIYNFTWGEYIDVAVDYFTENEPITIVKNEED